MELSHRSEFVHGEPSELIQRSVQVLSPWYPAQETGYMPLWYVTPPPPPPRPPPKKKRTFAINYDSLSLA